MGVLTHKATNERFEWTGTQLRPWDGSTNNIFDFDGTEWKPLNGNIGQRFTVEGSTLRSHDNNLDKMMELRDSGDVIPSYGNQDYAWEAGGSELRQYRDHSNSWDISGDIPIKVLACFAASVLNARLRGEPNDGAQDAFVPRHVVPRHDPWKNAPSTKVKIPLGCDNRCEWDYITDCPDGVRTDPQCYCCDNVIRDTPLYRLDCQCTIARYLCKPCGDMLATTEKKKIHKHPMTCLSRMMSRSSCIFPKTRCQVCDVKSNNGFTCVPCKEYYCSKCANYKPNDPRVVCKCM
eukprot:TRINITY_DN4910_c0_g1_i1.p1 TRINITY_DN4910_c0_g1~~TRINITY_DN4910_c0_g1_i1.p1  ORF type:complete len:311 (+),score=77.63 TRINITY_DN4910_c0_g1_i1:61-933(+)